MGRPSGTVTFLFTDIEGSTRLWDEHPSAMRVALARHDEILRSAIDACGGSVFSTGGDGVAAAFGRAGDAVAAAITGQRRLQAEVWPAPLRLRVRMGVHTGEVEERDGDYFGTPLNRTARIMGLGSGGQILMSSVTAELVDVTRRSEGLVSLRGLSTRSELFTVLAEGLESAFAPLRAADLPGNLPPVTVPLVGRQRAFDELEERLSSSRLVTLVGPGGIGKTSLAVELARRVEGRFTAGVWLVELAAVRDADDVDAALASTVGARSDGTRSLLDAALGLLGSGPTLIVLDNCEHVAEAASRLVRAVLSGSGAKVVATSRSPLHLRDEHVWMVPPLQFQGISSDAVRLFAERAAQVRSDFSMDEASTRAAAQICALVDGMPLAVELAAARCRSMSAAEVLARLERDAGRILRDARRDGEERQRTVHTAIGWSYDLLSGPEKELFARLSIFSGSFDLAAAEVVCSGGSVDEADVVDLLDALVDQSMVTLADRRAATRYRLLEPIRQFADAVVSDAAALQERHGRHYAGQAHIAYEVLWGEAEAEWIAQIEADFDNLRHAYRYWVQRGGLTEALTIAITLNQFGELALQRPAGAEVLFSALDLDGIESHDLGPIAMAHAAMAMARRQDPAGIPLATKALVLASTPVALWEVGHWSRLALSFLGHDGGGVSSWIGEWPEVPDHDASPRMRLWSAAFSASIALLHGDIDASERIRALPTRGPSSGIQSVLLIAHLELGEFVGDSADALVELAMETIEKARRAGNRWAAANTFLTAAPSLVGVLGATEVLPLLVGFMTEWRQANDVWRLRQALLYCVPGLITFGEIELAAELFGAMPPEAQRPGDALRVQLAAELTSRIAEAGLEHLTNIGRQAPTQTLADRAIDAISRHS